MAVAAVLLVATLPGTAGAQVTPRPDLTVSAGSVSAANGKLTGSFVVRNKGASGADGSRRP
jgi:hypothetical protein